MRHNMPKFYHPNTKTLYVCSTNAAVEAFVATEAGQNAIAVVEPEVVEPDPNEDTLPVAQTSLRRSHAGIMNSQLFFSTLTSKIVSPGINYDLEHSSNSDLQEIKHTIAYP